MFDSLLGDKDFRPRALSYGLCAMACSMLHSFFVSFYVDYFVRVNKFSLTWFAGAQVVYAVWNSCNDIGFGWVNDTSFSLLTRRRMSRITIGGPLWAAAFVLMWVPYQIPFVHPAVQFAAVLIIYDGFFSYTTVAFRALLVDISYTPRDREVCNAYAAFFHVIGSLSVGVASYLYEASPGTGEEVNTEASPGDSLFGFRLFSVVLAVAAGYIFYMSTYATSSKHRHEKVLASPPGFSDPPEAPATTFAELIKFAKQTCTRSSMRAVLVVWALQDYSCTFATNFFALFLAAVCGHEISPFMRSALLMMSFILPHFVIISITPLFQSIGKKVVVLAMLASRGFFALVILILSWRASSPNAPLVSHDYAILFAALLLANRVSTECVCRMQSLVLSDVCDEDTVVFSRPVSMAAALHGLVALASKPSQSLAPVVSCAALLLAGVSVGELNDTREFGAVGHAVPVMRLVGYTSLLTVFPMIAVWFVWYNLHGRYLASIQHAVARRSDSPDTLQMI